MSKGQTLEAATIWGRSSKSFEEVSLTFLELGDSDALRRYLLTKLGTLKRTVRGPPTFIRYRILIGGRPLCKG